MDNRDNKIVILGAGLAGLTCATSLNERGERPVVYEKENRIGGLVSTLTINSKQGDFNFDYTGHFLHLRTPETKNWILEKIPDLKLCTRKAAVFIKDARAVNHLVPAPYQNSVGLFSEKRRKKIKEQVSDLKRNENNRPAPKNFGEDQEIKYGRTLAKLSRRYNKKLYGDEVDLADPQQMGRFATNIPYDQVIRSAEGNETGFTAYNATFYYTHTQSKQHGIASLTQTLVEYLPKEDIHLKTYPVAIDLDDQKIKLNTGEIVHFREIVSTIPLPTLLQLMHSEKDEKELKNLKVAASKLKAQAVTWLAIGLKNSKDASMLDGNHWVYFPEKNSSFYRVGCFSNVDPQMAPEGCSSVWVELANNSNKSIEERKKEIIAYFIQSKWINSEDDVLFIEQKSIDTAYVIMDENYKNTQERIHAFLKMHQITSIGRYGKWEYASMGDAIEQGLETAKQLHQNKFAVKLSISPNH